MTNKLPDTVDVKDEPMYGAINCNDATERSVGQIRMSIEVLRELDVDYPFDVLPNEGLSTAGNDIFRLGEYGMVFHELDLSYTEEIYPWHTQWISVPDTEFEFEELYGDTVMYAPKEGLYIGSILKEDKEKFVNVWDTSGDLKATVEGVDVGFFEIPDQVISELLPEQYNSDLVSQSI
jgi:hypothetical protein